MGHPQKRKTWGLLLLLLFVAIFAFSGIMLVEQIRQPDLAEGEPIERKTIVRDGVEYFPRQDLDVFLVIGTDVEGPVKASGGQFNDGQADSIFLLVFDKTAEEVRLLTLNRDSMVTMPALNEKGYPSGTYYGHLAQSHAFGSGLEDSCENTRQTVSDLLGGIEIDHYVSFNLDAIALANDAVGGVTVTVTDDFSAVTEDIPVGEVTLHGDQAEIFVRGRKDVGDQQNTSRMERQKVYLESFLESLKDIMAGSETFALNLYEEISPYMVTDCSVTVFSEILSQYDDYTLAEILSPEGESVRGEEYMEFYLDEEALDELTVRLFFAPKS